MNGSLVRSGGAHRRRLAATPTRGGWKTRGGFAFPQLQALSENSADLPSHRRQNWSGLEIATPRHRLRTTQDVSLVRNTKLGKPSGRMVMSSCLQTQDGTSGETCGPGERDYEASDRPSCATGYTSRGKWCLCTNRAAQFPIYQRLRRARWHV